MTPPRTLDAAQFRALVSYYETGILDEEGAYHVHGVYYARAANAARQRRTAAERMARDAVRLHRIPAAAGVGISDTE